MARFMLFCDPGNVGNTLGWPGSYTQLDLAGPSRKQQAASVKSI